MPLTTLRRRTPEDRAAVRSARDTRADQMEERLAIPVIIAAGVTVPAVFLSVFTQGVAANVGVALNWASLTVLTAESVLLFLLTGHRFRWIWRHKWTLGILAVAIPAMIFIAAPAQALRFVLRAIHFFGALRILRAGRIIKAGRVVARRIGWDGKWRYVPIFIASAIAAVFVAVVLNDDTSSSRSLLQQYLGTWPRVVLVLIAGAILATATFIVVRNRRREQRTEPESRPEDVDDR